LELMDVDDDDDDDRVVRRLQLGIDDRVVQRFALAVLYYSTGGLTSWKVSWLSPSTECSWGEPNVDCNFNNVVDLISLPGEGLSGKIPGEIGLLSSLTYLDLNLNDLGGTIPTEIGLLSFLTGLTLRDNANVSGRVPTELANLGGLNWLHLTNTQLTGSVPSNLCVCPLQDVWVDCDDIECDCCTSGNDGVTPC